MADRTYTVMCSLCHNPMIVDEEDFAAGQEKSGVYNHMSCLEERKTKPRYGAQIIVFDATGDKTEVDEDNHLFRFAAKKHGDSIGDVIEPLLAELSDTIAKMMPFIMQSEDSDETN